MATSRLNSPGRGKGRRASNPEMGSRVPRRSGRGRRPSAPTEQNRASHSGSLAQEARLAFGLGWFGIGLGLAELLVPRRFARTIGVPYEHHRLIRAMGVREIANGLGILIWPSASAGIWVRVVGDMIDLACLGAAFTSPHANRSRLATTAAALAGAAAVDLVCAQQLTRGMTTGDGSTAVFKQVMETGEVITTEGQPGGRADSIS